MGILFVYELFKEEWKLLFPYVFFFLLNNKDYMRLHFT